MPALKPGSPLCRCGACERWFSNPNAFDAHWRQPERGRRSPNAPVACRDPALCGLVEREGVWRRERPAMLRGEERQAVLIVQAE